MKVSVCIPTFNQAEYLEIAINSVVNQTLTPFEIIVHNDCSTDETKKVLDHLCLHIKNLKVHHQKTNQGVAKNTDECLRAGTGEFIVRLDSDDYLLPDYVEKLSSLLSKFPKAGYAHASVQEVDENGRSRKVRTLFRDLSFQSADDALKSAVKGYRVAANIIMFRKAALQKVNYLKERPNFVEDFHLSADLAANGFGNAYSTKVLSCYRVWTDKKQIRKKRKLADIKGIQSVFRDILEPAFIKKKWEPKFLDAHRAYFAYHQADCLTWAIYNKGEKEELRNALLELSSEPKVKIVCWLYLRGFPKIANPITRIKVLAKIILRKSKA